MPLESMDELFEVKPIRKAHGVVVAQIREDEEQFRQDIKQGEGTHSHVEGGK